MLAATPPTGASREPFADSRTRRRFLSAFFIAAADPAGTDGRCLSGSAFRRAGQRRQHGRDGGRVVAGGGYRSLDAGLPCSVHRAGAGEPVVARSRAGARCGCRGQHACVSGPVGAGGCGQRSGCHACRFRGAVQCAAGGTAGGGLDHHGRAVAASCAAVEGCGHRLDRLRYDAGRSARSVGAWAAAWRLPTCVQLLPRAHPRRARIRCSVA